MNEKKTDLTGRRFALLGLAREAKLDLTEYILERGGEVRPFSDEAEELICDPERMEFARVKDKVSEGVSRGSLTVMTEALFYWRTEPSYRIGRQSEKIRLEICRYYLLRPEAWQLDEMGRREEMETLLIREVNGILPDLCARHLVGALTAYLDFLREKEKEWQKTGYSDGYFVLNLVRTWSQKAIEDQIFDLTSFFLDYQASHYDDSLIAEAEEVRNDIAFGLRTLPAAYYTRGSTVTLGYFPQGSLPGGESEPIEWEVITQETGRALIVSRKGLLPMPYHRKYEAVTWQDSDLRGWLNGEFFDHSFNEEEKRRILKAVTCHTDNSFYGISAGPDTEDRVFLLSLEEAEDCFSDPVSRVRTATPYAKHCGAYTYAKDSCFWWLRSPGADQSYAACVPNDGTLFFNGNVVTFDKYCVCPALWLDISIQEDELL